MNRRRLLVDASRSLGGLALTGLAVGRTEAAAAAPASSAPGGLLQSLRACSPGDALSRLQEGNARFAALWQQASQLDSPQQRMGLLETIWRDGCQIDPLALAQGQRPFAALLSCADSRVDPAWLFACGAGELFEVRSAGNTAFPEAIASLEFAVDVLAVPLILVLGHSGCGGVQAARGSGPLTPMLERLVEPIRATLVSGDDLSRSVQRNARSVADRLLEGSSLLGEAVAGGRLSIRSAYFEIASGLVTLL
jgi:carbonic anhydrase